LKDVVKAQTKPNNPIPKSSAAAPMGDGDEGDGKHGKPKKPSVEPSVGAQGDEKQGKTKPSPERSVGDADGDDEKKKPKKPGVERRVPRKKKTQKPIPERSAEAPNGDGGGGDDSDIGKDVLDSEQGSQTGSDSQEPSSDEDDPDYTLEEYSLKLKSFEYQDPPRSPSFKAKYFQNGW